MRNPYDILGVKPTATADEIRRAFRKLAKQTHPDLHPGDAAAEARFRDVNAAYDLLSDPAKRARFDRGEIDAEGRETFAHAYANASGGFHSQRSRTSAEGARASYHFDFNGHPGDLGDIFSHLFGEGLGSQASTARGRDVRQAVTVCFLDAALGGRRRVTLPDGRPVDVTIPEGLKDGQTLRLKGQGEGGRGSAGDLLLEVHIAPHPQFRRQGDDVHADLPVSLGEAVNGGRVTVPTIHGPVVLTVRPGSNTGTVMRLKGKGIKGGDHYVTLKLVLPKTIDPELAAFVAGWSDRHPYDPRGES
jgi:DnaJ-class molecular chaperone